MARDANPVFEVATIKPSRPEAQGKGCAVRSRQFSTLDTTVTDRITFRNGIHARQVSAGPARLEGERYDLTAKPDGRASLTPGNGRPCCRTCWRIASSSSSIATGRNCLYRDRGWQGRTQADQERRRSERTSRPVFP